MRIAAARADQLFPGGFRLRAHVGDTVSQSCMLQAFSLVLALLTGSSLLT